tara:strand:+ start:434 stop:571 length:138 start_codon:yes stop_codon:yes gene_type:complete
MIKNLNNKKAPKEKITIPSLPFAGIIQIRFEGCDLSSKENFLEHP